MPATRKPILDKSQSILKQIAEHKAYEVEVRKSIRPLDTFCDSLPDLTAGRFEASIQNKANKHPKLILEIKPASPSQGSMRPELENELPQILKYYERFGVAISVLTDQAFFGGGLALLKTVAQSVTCPALCKEFILDPYQVYEAREAGASAILLIVKMLSSEQLSLLFEKAKELHLTPVVEIQNEQELETALALQANVILINHRDLDTLALDMNTVERLASLIPENVIKIAASGISERSMFERLHPYCDAYLVGSALMKKPLSEWETLLSEWHKPFQ